MSESVLPADQDLFTYRQQASHFDHFLWAILLACPGLLIGLTGTGDETLAAVLGTLGGGLVGYLLARLFRWLHRKDHRIALSAEAIEFSDVYLGTGAKRPIRAKVEYFNIKSVVASRLGVGLALRDPERFFVSYGPDMVVSNRWRDQDRRLKARSGTDLWIPAEMVSGDPSRFAQRLQEKMKGIVPPVPFPEVLRIFTWNAKADLKRMLWVIGGILILFVAGLNFMVKRGSADKLSPGWMSGVIGVVLSTVLFGAARSSRVRTIVRAEGLTVQDGRYGAGIESDIPYGDIQAVQRVKGKGVGLKLFQTAPWFASARGPAFEIKTFRQKQGQWKTSKGFDLWLPDSSLWPGPEKFAEELGSRVAAPTPAPATLDLEKAAYSRPGAAGLKCAVCDKSLEGEYWELNGAAVCPACKETAGKPDSKEGRWGRVFRALLWGGLAALVGGGLFLWVTLATDMVLGLLTLLVGWMVGAGVRKGAQKRGGWFYQLMAVSLTYFSFSVVFLGITFAQIASHGEKASKGKKDAAVSIAAGAPVSAAVTAVASPVPDAVTSPAPVTGTLAAPVSGAGPASVASGAAKPVTLPGKQRPQAPAEKDWFGEMVDKAIQKGKSNLLVGLLLILLLVLVGLALVPILAFQSSPVTGALLCFGLWEAWRMNKRQPFVLKGPFKTAVETPPSASPADPA